MLLLEESGRRNIPPMASYFQEINETALLGPDDERELARRVQEGDSEARAEMVKANLRLVVALARPFVGRGLCLTDLIQEGNLGLVHAVERFDPEQNTRFSTYAKFWIKEAIANALERTASPVRVSAYANKLMNDWRKVTSDLHEELGRNPNDEEIAGRLQMSKRQLAIVKKAQQIHSFSHLVSDDEAGVVANTLVDTRTSRPDAGLCADDEMHQVLQFLDQLPSREARVLRLRYGLSGKNPMTLQDIGATLDLTRERVRQIEKDALAKLRDLIEAAA